VPNDRSLQTAGRRHLELIGKLDQLIPMLQTLEIQEIITTREVDKQRAAMKRQVKGVATTARNLEAGLRKRMNAQGVESEAEAHAGTAATPGAAGAVDAFGSPAARPLPFWSTPTIHFEVTPRKC
jgi:hypothetical protein